MADDGGWSDSDEPASDDARTDGQGPIDPSPEPSSEGGDETTGNVAGSITPGTDVTPETPTLEHVVFVALGVYITILAFGRFIAGAAIYDPATLAAVTFAVAAGTALLYGFFVRID